MLHRAPPPIRVRHGWRALIATAAGLLLLLSMAAAPVGATVVLRDHSRDDYAFSFDDCGFWIDVTGHDSGVAHFRVGKGGLDTAFLLLDNYAYRETWTRRDTGDFFTVSGNGVFHETKATHVSGTVFEFTSIESGQPFIVRDANGNLVLRDRGVIRRVVQFDTLGDHVPGGAFVQDVSFSVHGPHPGLEFHPCGYLS